MQGKTRHIILAVLILCGCSFIVYWLSGNPSYEFTRSVPGLDNRGSKNAVAELVNIGEFFELFKEAGESLNETWPRFRGEDFDNISKSTIPLIDRFPEGGPEILWSVELGEGHAGPAIYKGLVYLLDYDEEMKADMLRCFSLVEGEEL